MYYIINKNKMKIRITEKREYKQVVSHKQCIDTDLFLQNMQVHPLTICHQWMVGDGNLIIGVGLHLYGNKKGE